MAAFLLIFCLCLTNPVSWPVVVAASDTSVAGGQARDVTLTNVQKELSSVAEDMDSVHTRTIQKRTASSCDEGFGAVVAQMVSEQSSLIHKLDALESTVQTNKEKLEASNKALQSTMEELQVTKSELQASKEELLIHRGYGSTFVRWGRTTCPNNTTRVYRGVAGGKGYTNKGSGTNRLCLTKTPQFDDAVSVPANYGFIYGAEYQDIPGHHDHDVPCSVCLVQQSTTIMIPGTLSCPPGWVTQYKGHLYSAHYNHFATEYVCIDGAPEHGEGGAANTDGHLIYHVIAQCGTLPCPPYVQGKVVTCVVCSK